MKIVINTDGGSRGNPGPAGTGVVVRYDGWPKGPCHKLSTFIGTATNNQAEYRALIRALEYMSEEPLFQERDEIEVRSDSELMVRQMSGEYECKNKNIRDLYIEAKALVALLDVPVTFTHIYREDNKEADLLANFAMDREESLRTQSE